MTRVATLRNQRAVSATPPLSTRAALRRAPQPGRDEDAQSPSPILLTCKGPPNGGPTKSKTPTVPSDSAHDDPLEWLAQLNNLPTIDEVYVDTAGWFDLDPDGAGDGLETSFRRRTTYCSRCDRRGTRADSTNPSALTPPREPSGRSSNRANSPTASSSTITTAATARTGSTRRKSLFAGETGRSLRR